MSFDEITAGLKELLVRNSYNPNTIKFYEREWRKIRDFILEEYGDDVFDIERGLAYLEKTYHFKTKYDNGTISQQRVQLLRVVNMLEDYRLHQVLTRRYFVHSNPIKLTGGHAGIHNAYVLDLSGSELSRSTVEHYTSISKVFLDYLAQKKIYNPSEIKLDSCHGYLKTLVGLSFKTVEQNVCGLRHFLRYLQENGIIKNDLASELHMPVISKQAKIPSCWSEEELKKLLASIDRNSPIGKRDYAMILLACVLGIRIGDIKRLTFENFDWTNKKISFTQHKTHKPLSLPLPDAIGWAVIDYIKNGRPKLFETNVVFIKHMPPYCPFSDGDHLQGQIIRYMNKAGIRRDKNRHSGFHSLRHSVGSMLLEMETPLPVITSILGHTDTDVTGIYLKTDLNKLAECILPPEAFNYDGC